MVWDLLSSDARVYVCGATRMGTDVQVGIILP
jgi:sulfite reductase alpha subunit-like flavoprotein